MWQRETKAAGWNGCTGRGSQADVNPIAITSLAQSYDLKCHCKDKLVLKPLVSSPGHRQRRRIPTSHFRIIAASPVPNRAEIQFFNHVGNFCSSCRAINVLLHHPFEAPGRLSIRTHGNPPRAARPLGTDGKPCCLPKEGIPSELLCHYSDH